MLSIRMLTGVLAVFLFVLSTFPAAGHGDCELETLGRVVYFPDDTMLEASITELTDESYPEGGVPIEGAVVTLYNYVRLDGSPPANGLHTETTDKDGNFSVWSFGHLECYSYLMAFGINKNGFTYLYGTYWTSGQNKFLIVLKPEDPESKMRKEQLFEAAKEGRTEDIQALLDGGVEVDERGQYGETALMFAARGGHLEAVKELLDRRGETDARNAGGWTALTMAAVNGHAKIAQFLIQAGAAVDAKDKRDRTPLWLAAHEGHVETVRLLLSEGADVNSRDVKKARSLSQYYSHTTPLIEAASRGHTYAVQALIEAGAEVDAQDALHRTSLIWATERGHTEVVKILLQVGADVNAKSKKGWTALMRATEKGHTEIVELLKKAGAKE